MQTSTIRSRRVNSRSIAWAAAMTFAGAALAHGPAQTRVEFDPPAPGTYRLERIMQAPDGKVIDTRRKRSPLSAYTRGKVTLLSLMYTACSDENGCPLAFYSIAMIKRDLEKSAAMVGQVRVVSLSFDPERDTPEVMRAYGGDQLEAQVKVPWHFLTTASRRELVPLLDGLGQDVSRPSKAGAGQELTHVLKLFLIDGEGWVREIYTTSYLVPQVVLNDIKTLLMERGVGLN
jgi:protein SCO1